MTPLDQLAEAAGVARNWRDAEHLMHHVEDKVLVAVLGALGYPATSENQQQLSLDRLREERDTPPSFLSGDVGHPITLPPVLAQATHADLHPEQGEPRTLAIHQGQLPPFDQPGYHRLVVEEHVLTLALAPSCCPPIAKPGHKRWGVAVQVPSLRDRAGNAYGTLADLPGVIAAVASHGADAVAISPTHALLPGDGQHFSPYSPSSRLFLNGALACPVEGLSPEGLIDWATQVPRQFAMMREAYARLTCEERDKLNAWAGKQGPALHRHALFNVLSRRFKGMPWQQWPAAYRDPDGEAARQVSATQGDEISLHLYIQQQVSHALAAAQWATRAHGMDIGLIADLAVGVDPSGSDAWSMGETMLRGLTIGAPPDPLGPLGQNWGLTSFSPQGLRRTGFAPFIAILRAVMTHAGGVRIDHAFGLKRLWVVPAGLSAAQGAYLSYPVRDLLRLVTLEAHRAGAIVIAEDLGTHPPGFTEAIAARGMAGMRVLWFEREGDGAFRPPRTFPQISVAMTGTHDTPTITGWWRGRDLAWDRALGRRTPRALAMAEVERAVDRNALWSAMGKSGPVPARDDPAPVVDAALAHIGSAGSALAIVPLEDVLELEEQPNLPGTTDEHPNWRRRLPAPFEDLAAQPAVARRLDELDRSRRA